MTVKKLGFLWINNKKLSSTNRLFDYETVVIEPKTKYSLEAKEDEYSLTFHRNNEIYFFISGRIVKSENFSNLNRVFTFFSDDGQKFEIIFDEMGGTRNQRRYPPIPNKLDVNNNYANVEFGVEQNIDICPIV